MPIFEYRCKECGPVTAFREKAGSRRKHACEACSSTSTEKAFSTFAARSGGSPSAGACPRRETCTSDTCPLSK